MVSQLDGCGQFMKYVLFFFNFVIFILGLTVCGLGIWTLVDSSNVEKIIGNNYYIPAAAILLTFGGVVAFISFLGCCGAIKEVKCLLGLFFIIMLLLSIVIVLGAIFGLTVGSKVTEELEKAMQESMGAFKDSKPELEPVREAWNEIQQKFNCCGAASFKDWEQHGGFATGTFPDSCCKPDFPKCQANILRPDSFYKEGCVGAVEAFVEKHVKPLAGIGITIAIIIVLSMIFSCALCLMI